MPNQPHAAVTSHFIDLTFAEQLLLWGLRQWVQAFQGESSTHGVTLEGYRIAGAPEAYPAIDGLMTVLAGSGQGNVEIRCPKCPNVSDDEHRLMGAVAAWQDGADHRLSDAFLEKWMRPAALRIARQPVPQLAAALKSAGLIIRDRPFDRYASISSPLTGSPSPVGVSGTLH